MGIHIVTSQMQWALCGFHSLTFVDMLVFFYIVHQSIIK